MSAIRLIILLLFTFFISIIGRLFAQSKDSIKSDRFEKEIIAFEEQDRAAPAKPGVVLFTGSSSVRLWDSLAMDFEPMPVLNRGFGGSTIPEVLHYFDRIMKANKPSLIVFYCGENDLTVGYSADEVFDNFMKFVAKSREFQPNTPVYFMAIKPSPSRKHIWEKAHDVNMRIKKISKKNSDIGYLDTYSVLLDKEGNALQGIYKEDLLHLNQDGYTIWRKKMKPILWKAYQKRLRKKK